MGEPQQDAVPGLPTYRTDDPNTTRLPREQLVRMQEERLQAILPYAYATSGFWRRKWDEAGVDVHAIRGSDDMRLLPFTNRAEISAEQDENPPFGDYTCTPRDQWSGIFVTSGTSGRRLRRVVSGRDWQMMVDRFRRAPAPPAGELYMQLGPIDGMLGPSVSIEAARARGSVPILAGLWDTRAKVQAIHDLRPGVIAGAASYLIHLSEVATEMGIDLSRCGLRMVSSAGEPGVAIDATHAELRGRFGVEQIADGYGLTEIGPLGGNCPQSPALHLADDMVLAECIDPETGERVKDGQPGELVFTNLVMDTHPLIRYRAGDIGRLTVSTPCACGSTVTRIERIEGRSDDMIWYRGVNFFPSAVEQIVRAQSNLSLEYRIVLEGGGSGLPQLIIQVEALREAGDEPGLPDMVRAHLRSGLGINPVVEVLPHGSLPRFENTKAKRVLHRRQNTITDTGGSR